MINRNFKNIYENVGSNIQDTSSAMATVIKRMVNEIYFDLLRRINFESINYDYSFTTTTKDNVLPFDFYKEIAVYDNTNKNKLDKTNQQKEIDNSVDSIDSVGSVNRYAILDSPVRKQPSTAAVPSIVSSSTSDVSQNIFIRGVSSGVQMTETINLNGTTPVSATNSYSRYSAVNKDGETVGLVTITHGSDTIAILSPEDIDYKVKIIRLYNTPAQSITINLPYTIKPLPFNNDNDTPIIDVSDVIELGATSRALQYKRQFSKAKDYRAMYEQGILNLIWERENNPNDSHIFAQGNYSRETC